MIVSNESSIGIYVGLLLFILFIPKFNESRDEATREDTSIFIDKTRHDIKELVANEMYDKLTILLNDTKKNLVYRKVDL